MSPKSFRESSREDTKGKSEETKKSGHSGRPWLATAVVGGLLATSGGVDAAGASHSEGVVLHPFSNQCRSNNWGGGSSGNDDFHEKSAEKWPPCWRHPSALSHYPNWQRFQDSYSQPEVCSLTENMEHLSMGQQGAETEGPDRTNRASEIDPRAVVEAMSKNPEMIGKIVKAMSKNPEMIGKIVKAMSKNPEWTRSMESAMKNNPNIENTLKATYQKFKEEEASSRQQEARDAAGLFGYAITWGGVAVILYAINKRIEQGEEAIRQLEEAPKQLHINYTDRRGHQAQP